MSLSKLFLSSGDIIADRRYGYAVALAERGDLAAAADLFAEAVGGAPQFAGAWFALGAVRLRLGDRTGAIEAFARAKSADPQDRHGATLQLVRLGAAEITGMPAGYVRTLFDQYAPTFDAALLGRLAYRAPELLCDAVARVCGALGRSARFAAMLDLGCGTGLAGAAFRTQVDMLTGVDLSPGMVAMARLRGIYDRLEPIDLMDFLRSEPPDAPPYDLILAADVLAYFSDLQAVAHAIASRLASGGLLALTVETHDGNGVILADTLRYAHGVPHVHAAITAAGLEPVVLYCASARIERDLPVPGLVVVASKPAW